MLFLQVEFLFSDHKKPTFLQDIVGLVLLGLAFWRGIGVNFGQFHKVLLLLQGEGKFGFVGAFCGDSVDLFEVDGVDERVGFLGSESDDVKTVALPGNFPFH